MARYNTAPQTLEVTGETEFTYAFTGGIISLTGTTGYTVTMVSPVFFPGSRQTFYNATDGMITLETAAGQITGNGVTLGTSVDIPTNSTYQITSDGADYVLTSALAGTTVFELPVTFNDVLNADAKVELNPLDNNVEIKPTGSGIVDISPQSSVSIQPGAQATIRPTGDLTLASASGSVSLGEAGKATSFPGNISFTADNQTINMSPTGTGSVTIDPGGNVTIGAGGTLNISSDTLGGITNMSIGASNPSTGAFTSITAGGSATFTANAASTSTTSGSIIVTGGAGISGDIYAGSLQGTPIGSSSRSTALFTNLGSNGDVAFTKNVASTNTTTGTLVVAGGVGIAGALHAGSIQNTAIGSSTRSSGAFTTLTSNSTVDFTATTEATDATGDTGTLRVEGGASIAKRVYSGGGFQGAIGNVSRSTGAFTTLTANSTVTLSPGANVTLSPTGSGTVTLSPAGGGSINNMSIGATTRSTAQFTSINANSTVTFSSVLDLTATTDSNGTNGDNGTLRCEGGASIAKRVYSGGGFFGSLSGNVSGNLTGNVTSTGTSTFSVVNVGSRVDITNTTDATDSSGDTGALRVEGGVSVAKRIFAGGTIVANGGTQGIIGYSPQNSSTTLADSDRKYIVSNTGSITLTLPATGTDGRTIVLVDGNNWGSFNCTLARNGKNIGGVAENLVLNVSNSKVELVYRGGDWKVFLS
jgi:fibronectin-binding autotransporter adhesin